MMIGFISSVDTNKENGIIIEKNSGCRYFFSFNSIIDASLKPAIKQPVIFEGYSRNEKEYVAVRIRPASDQNNNFLNATVSWFSTEKRYGYVTCENSFDAFLHIKYLLEIGLQQVNKGQHVKVKIRESKYPGRKEVFEIIVDSNSQRKEYSSFPKHHSSESQKYNSLYHQPLKKCSANDFTAIPSSSSNETSSAQRSFNAKPLGAYKNCHYQHPIHEGNSSYGHSAPPTMSGASGVFPAPFSYFPKMNGHSNKHSLSRNFETCYSVSPRHPRSNGPVSLNQSKSLNRDKIEEPRLYSPQPSKVVTNPEYAKIKQQIHQKEGLLKHIKVSKLPDAGQRLHDQIKCLKKKLNALSMYDNTDEQVTSNHASHESLSSDKICKALSEEPQCLQNQCFKEPYNKSTYYGGRMTSKSVAIVHKVTVEAIEELHKSLNTCPPSTTELPDPDGLNITLMTHQRQALAWMVWREKQTVSGGILADDMGLGKTLTMISLIMAQSQSSNQKKLDLEFQNHQNDDTSSIVTETNNADHNDDNDDDDIVSKLNKLKVEDTSSVKSEEILSNTHSLFQSTLIISPASLIYHWENEIRNRCRKGLFSIHLYHGNDREKDPEKLSEFDVVITTYDIVRRNHGASKSSETKESKPVKQSTVKEDTLFQIKWKRVILDEAHQIRNFKSLTSQAVCSLQARSRWAMSGTPVQNEEDDLYAMIKFLHCEPFDELKLWKNQVGNKTKVGRERLKSLVSCFVLRREKQQKGKDGNFLVDLPERNFIVHKLKLNEIEQQIYNKLSEESRSAFEKYQSSKKTKSPSSNASSYSRHNSDGEQKLSATALLVKLLRLRQCCGHLNLLKDSFDIDLLQKEKQQVSVEDLFQSLTLKEEIPDHKFVIEKYVDDDKSGCFDISKDSSKLKAVMNIIHTLNFEKPGDKMVIVSQWTSMLRVVSHHLDRDKLTYAVIDGSVTAKKRMNFVDEFNRNPIQPKIMLVSLQAGGVGLNLIGGNHLFLLDMHWNPALEKQAFDRIYRVGQTKDVFIHKFVVEGSVEEQIFKLQEEKLAVAESVMEGAGIEKKVKLTLTDMKALFNI